MGGGSGVGGWEGRRRRRRRRRKSFKPEKRALLLFSFPLSLSSGETKRDSRGVSPGLGSAYLQEERAAGIQRSRFRFRHKTHAHAQCFWARCCCLTPVGPPPLSRQAHAAPSPAHGPDVTRDTTMGSKATCSEGGRDGRRERGREGASTVKSPLLALLCLAVCGELPPPSPPPPLLPPFLMHVLHPEC